MKFHEDHYLVTAENNVKILAFSLLIEFLGVFSIHESFFHFSLFNLVTMVGVEPPLSDMHFSLKGYPSLLSFDYQKQSVGC